MRVSRVILTIEKSVNDILRALTNRITVADNLDAVEVSVADTGTANTEFTVTHNLGRVPDYYIYNISKSGYVYDSNRASWTTTTLKLKCSAANAALVMIVL